MNAQRGNWKDEASVARVEEYPAIEAPLARMGEIPEYLDKLDEVIGNLTGKLDQLAGEISPVLAKSQPVEGQKNGDRVDSTKTDLGQRLDNSIDRVLTLQGCVNDLLSRLEL